ncbi:MAG: InlB B-repeat-containing protein [Lachnospiraceae bacterium]|nr:InlB B-repeat-containing protein [Lachnospiraceae bacterium]
MDPDVWEFGIVDVESGKYSVTTRSNPSDGGTTSGGKTVKSGSDVELLAAPNNGYKFVNWTIDGNAVSSDQKYVLKNVKKNTEVVANFAQTNCYVKVKANHPEGGKISDSVNVLYGTSTKLKAKPNSGFEFKGWYEDDERISKKEEFVLENITSNREIVAKFERTSYAINVGVYPDKTGVVFGAGNYAKGSTVTLTAKPIDGYTFDGWVYNNDVVSKNTDITISNIGQDFSLTATFKKKGATVYNIKSSVAEGQGKITPSGNNSFVQGDNVTYRFVPSNGYVISAVIVDGTNVGAVSSYTFDKLAAGHNISVKFAKTATPGGKDPATPADKKGDEETKKEKEETAKELEETFEKPDADAEELDQLDPEEMAEFYGYADAVGVLQELDITESEARELIRQRQDRLLLEKAAENQFLAVSVNNDYSSNARETEEKSYFEVASIPNLGDVVDGILTEEEKIECFKGNPIQVNMNIFSNNQFQTKDDKEMARLASKNHMVVGNFFEAVLMKSNSGRTECVTELSVPMQIVLEIPNNIKAEGREFCILRAHQTADGTEYEFLDNESNDSDKIMFTTDRFSSYAICYKGGKSTGLTMMKAVNTIIVVLIIILGLAVSLLLLIFVNESNKRKARKAHAAHNKK